MEHDLGNAVIEESVCDISIGDYISLGATTPSGDGVLFGGGILDDHVEMSVNPPVFDNCLFQVCMRNRLSASMQMQAVLAKHQKQEEAGVELGEEEEEAQRSFLETLERVKRNEHKLNMQLFADQCGQPVHFGDVIQLRHVKSGRWLTVSPSEVARTERENLRVHLHTEGTTCSWFTVLPSMTVDEEGMVLENMASAILGVTDRTDEFLHYSHEEMIKPVGVGVPGAFEVNCSLDASPLRIISFNSFEPPDSAQLMAGQVVSFLDSDSNTTLYLLSETERGAVADADQHVANQPFFQACGTDHSQMHSGSLWVIERVLHDHGGPLGFGDEYHFRHVNSGKYMSSSLDPLAKAALPEAGLDAPEDDDKGFLFASDVASPFTLGPMARGQSKDVSTMTPVHVAVAEAAWITNGRWVESAGNMCLASVVNDKSLALVLQLVRAAPKLVGDCQLVLCAMPHLRRFLDTTRAADKDGMLEGFAEFESVVVKVQDFLIDNDKSDPESGVFTAYPWRQRIAREQGAIEFFVDTLEALNPLVSRAKTKKGQVQLGEEAVKMLRDFTHLCFRTLQFLVINNHENQLFLADSFSALVPFLDASDLAMRCMNEMLNNNMEVQEKKIGQHVLDQFIQMLRDSTMNYTILSVLRAICSCQGRGIDSNQTMLATLLLIQGQDLLIQVRENEVNQAELKVLCPGEVNEVALDSLHGRAEKYFIAQLNTFAEMCFDRNYIAMSILHEMLPYSVLVKVVDSTTVSASLRASAVRLVSYLYVDCKPQEEFRFDNLTFAWNQLQAEVKLPEPTQDSECETDNFAGLKSVVSKQLRNMGGGKWTSFTQQTMMICQQLVSFKFYSSESELSALARPLVAALDPNASPLEGSQASTNVDSTLGSMNKLRRVSTNKVGSSASRGSTLASASGGDVTQGSSAEESAPGAELKGVIVPRASKKPQKIRIRRSRAQQKMLDHLEGMRMLVSMLGLVFLSVTVSIIGEVRGDDMASSGYRTFDIITAVIFTVEMLTRMWSLNSVKLFFSDGFCIVDFLVVALDILTLAAAGLLGSAGGFTKALRAIRLARLARVLRAARIVSKLVFRHGKVIVWTPPARYSSTAEMRMLTMVRAVQVLRDISRLGHCYRLWTLVSQLKKYHGMQDDERKRSQTTLASVFEVAVAAGKPLSLTTASGSQDVIDEVLLDLCLHKNDTLVHEALQLLVMLHSESRLVLADLKHVQLLVGPLEQQYTELERKVSELKYQVETQELWGALETDEHRAASQSVKDILRDLAERCKLEMAHMEVCSTLTHAANPEIQTMLRNLGLFDVLMMAMALTAELENEDDDEGEHEDGGGAEEFAEEEKNTREILKLCCTLTCWFVYENPENQKLAMSEFNTFVDNIGADIGTSHVLVCILRGNLNMIKLVPDTFIRMATNQIVNKGRKAKFLDMLDVLTHIGEAGIKTNQIEVVKQLTSQDIARYVLSLPAKEDTEEYTAFMDLQKAHAQQQAEAKRVRAVMLLEEAANEREEDQKLVAVQANKAQAGEVAIASDDIMLNSGLIQNAHLPEEINYYCRVLETLSGCAAGMINIVEAKVQSLVSYDTALHHLLHPDTLIEVRCALSRFFYDVIVDVQIFVPGLNESELMWEYLDTFPEWLQIALGAGGEIAQEGVASSVVAVQRQRVGYAVDCLVPILLFYYKNYYNTLSCPVEDDVHATWYKRVYRRLCALHNANFDFLAEEQRSTLLECVVAVYTEYGEDAVGALPGTITDDKVQKINQGRRRGSAQVIPARTVKHASVSGEDPAFRALRNSFVEYTSAVAASDPARAECKGEVASLIEYMKDLPRVDEDQNWTDLRYEPVLAAWVAHLRTNITTTHKGRSIESDKLPTAIWVIRFFRSMIEHEWGFSIHKRDDEGDEQSDEAVNDVQLALDAAGATTLCLDLISPGIELRLVLEAVNLLVALLYKEGGNVHVQQTIYDHLVKPESRFFFACAEEQMQAITNAAVNEEGGSDDEDDEDGGDDGGGDNDSDDDDDEANEGGGDVIPDDMLILVRMLQLCCEGHFLPNQDIMRTQPKSNVNLLDSMAHHLSVAVHLPKSSDRTEGALQFADTILEVIQGPCVGNQEHLAINTELVEVLNRMMRAKEDENDCDPEDEGELKATVLAIYKALLEGQTKPSVIYERILSVIHVDALQMLVLPKQGSNDGTGMLSTLQVNALVLVQMLSDYDPELSNDLTLPKDIMYKMRTQVVSIEVFWNGTLQRRFFPVPEMCQKISNAAKDHLVEHVDRSNPELKLLDFVKRSNDMFIELQHEEFLTDWHVDWIFNRVTQDRATWISFFIACFVNLLILGEQHEDPGCGSKAEAIGGCITMSPAANVDDYGWFSRLAYEVSGSRVDLTDFLTYLNVVQIIFASFTFVLFVVVRVPVKYQLTRIHDGGRSVQTSVLAAVTDASTLYYFGYVCVCILVKDVSPLFASVLLLDIVMKNSTTRDVLRAVIIPAKQLMATLVLMVFVIYIISFFLECDTLLSCFQTTAGYGLRQSGGIGDQTGMDGRTDRALGPRFVVDFLFFAIVLIVLVNIIFGIIIDTFSELREKKKEREAHTVGTCFICGLDKLIFDRSAETLDQGFRRHIKEDHYMWSYLKFMIFLHLQDQDDDDGLELYVRQCLESDDLSWLPMDKALCLVKSKADGEVSMVEQTATAVEDLSGTQKTQTEIADELEAKMAELQKLQEKMSVGLGGGKRGSAKFRLSQPELE
eukprot:g2362.t1